MNPSIKKHIKKATDAWGFPAVLDALSSIAEDLEFDQGDEEIQKETDGFIRELSKLSERFENNPKSFLFLKSNRFSG